MIIQDPVTRAAVPDNYLDGVLRRLWWRKLNTQEMAPFLKVPEHFVAKRLAIIRDAERAQ